MEVFHRLLSGFIILTFLCPVSIFANPTGTAHQELLPLNENVENPLYGSTRDPNNTHRVRSSSSKDRAINHLQAILTHLDPENAVQAQDLEQHFQSKGFDFNWNDAEAVYAWLYSLFTDPDSPMESRPFANNPIIKTFQELWEMHQRDNKVSQFSWIDHFKDELQKAYVQPETYQTYNYHLMILFIVFVYWDIAYSNCHSSDECKRGVNQNAALLLIPNAIPAALITVLGVKKYNEYRKSISLIEKACAVLPEGEIGNAMMKRLCNHE